MSMLYSEGSTEYAVRRRNLTTDSRYLWEIYPVTRYGCRSSPYLPSYKYCIYRQRGMVARVKSIHTKSPRFLPKYGCRKNAVIADLTLSATPFWTVCYFRTCAGRRGQLMSNLSKKLQGAIYLYLRSRTSRQSQTTA